MGIRKYLGIAFLAGLFLIGVGGGVTFVEFSSFQLGEERVIGNEFMETNARMRREIEEIRKGMPEDVSSKALEKWKRQHRRSHT